MSLPSITVYRSAGGLFAQRGEDLFQLRETELDVLFTVENPAVWLREQFADALPVLAPAPWLAPIQSQEVWAAGVTYLRSRAARIDEANVGGNSGSFYDKVYDAARPELFFKATPHRVVGHGGIVRIRSDATWNIPEPELALAINSRGVIFGYTIGNDMSSRDIEGENPLYLPQAKVYRACCGLGPGIVVREPLSPATEIQIHIWRGGAPTFSGRTALDQMKRKLPELAEYLFRDNEFPRGLFLLTGTGIIPPNEFTLASGDEIRIHIAGLGLLTNVVG